ncbi:hypothetical protein BH11BAC3_BH11BAC3_08190 [soil metagenome]
MSSSNNQESSFENDTVKIVYSFWSESGSYSFSVYNKLNLPLYIDWKKSSLVKNNDKLNYWSDEILTKSTSKRKQAYSYFGYSLLSSESGFSSSIKPEQVTFIAPKSTIYKIQFALNAKSDPKLPKTAAVVDVKRSDNPKKKTKIAFLNYDEKNTPIFFRNFMTLSTSDKFEKEFYIDNGFYVFKVSEMTIQQLTASSAATGMSLMKAPSPYKKASSFYVLSVK